MSKSTRNIVKRMADEQRRLSEEAHTSSSFEKFVKWLTTAQRGLFEVMLFLLFATTAYRLLDHELHLTEKFYALAAMISAYMGS
jgi:hypothetical protein